MTSNSASPVAALRVGAKPDIPQSPKVPSVPNGVLALLLPTEVHQIRILITHPICGKSIRCAFQLRPILEHAVLE
jgi:hypothetical protein